MEDHLGDTGIDAGSFPTGIVGPRVQAIGRARTAIAQVVVVEGEQHSNTVSNSILTSDDFFIIMMLWFNNLRFTEIRANLVSFSDKTKKTTDNLIAKKQLTTTDKL